MAQPGLPGMSAFLSQSGAKRDLERAELSDTFAHTARFSVSSTCVKAVCSPGTTKRATKRRLSSEYHIEIIDEYWM
jgi:hypothetical protein